jgi:hypothetical protein
MDKTQVGNIIDKDSLDKLSFILNQKKEDEIENDIIIKHQIKEFFLIKDNDYRYITDNKIIENVIPKIIDIMLIVFSIPKTERIEFYNKSIYNIKDEDFFPKLKELQLIEKFDIDFSNPKIKNLFKLLSTALDVKTDYSFSEYIDSIFFNMSFFKGLEKLLKFQLFQFITKYYLLPVGVLLDFKEKDINITDDTPLDLITELFTKNQNDFESLVKSIIFVNYGALSKSIKNYKFNEILSAINSMHIRLKKIENLGSLSICVETVTTMLIDELNKQKYQNKKKKKSKKAKKSKKIDTNKNIQINDIENSGKSDNQNIASENQIYEDMPNDKKEIFTEEKNKEENTINESNDIADNKIKINQFDVYFNNLFNYLRVNNMGNESIINDVKNIQKIMKGLSDDNNKMKNQMEDMKQNMLKLNEDIKNEKETLNQRMKNLEERVDYLTKENNNIKEILGNIQCRDLSKKFLRAFTINLTDNDWKLIRKNKEKKGKIISDRIKKLYPKADEKKMNLVKILIEKSTSLILGGNDLAHHVEIEDYQEEIKAYKEEKNIKKLTSPLAFCLLISLGIPDDLFDDAYSFMEEYFDSELEMEYKENLLDLYFN